MFYLENGKGPIGGITFEIPNKMSVCKKNTNKNKITFFDKETSIVVCLENKQGDIPPINSKRIICFNIDSSPAAELSMNGLWGWYIKYKSISKYHYRAFLKNTSQNSYYIEMRISVNKKRASIDEVLSREEIVSFFCSLKAE